MLCERCKIREANLLYTEIMDGVQREHHFCIQCAKEMDFGQYSSIFDRDFPLAKLLSGLLREEAVADKKNEYTQVFCPVCKTGYEDFINNSRFGCKDCYEVFRLLIEENIKQLQGSDTHKGKRPADRISPISRAAARNDASGSGQSPEGEEDRETKINRLKIMLKAAIASEEYELAAQCRDEIKSLSEGE